ncbi:MAG: methyltransferase domain-containing protein [bacterium]
MSSNTRFVCPHCGSELKETNRTYDCPNCDRVVGKHYPEFENFLLDIDLDDDFQEFYEEEGTKGDDCGGPRISAQQFKVPNIKRVLPDDLEPDRWLDAGCGGGWIIEKLLQEWESGRVAGLDISETRLVEAHHRNPEVEFIRAPVEKIPYPDNSFELVTALDVIEHIPDPGALLKEAHRLSPNLVIKFPIEDTLFDRFQKEFWWPLKRTLKHWMKGKQPPEHFEPHLHRFNFQSARDLLRDHDFEIVTEHISENPWEDNHATLYPPAYNITPETPWLRRIDFHTKRFILLTMMRSTHLLSPRLYYKVFSSGIYFHCRRQ